MAEIQIILDGDPAVSMSVDEEDFYCCGTDDALFWCEWCGQWECEQRLCCQDCAGNHSDECQLTQGPYGEETPV